MQSRCHDRPCSADLRKPPGILALVAGHWRACILAALDKLAGRRVVSDEVTPLAADRPFEMRLTKAGGAAFLALGSPVPGEVLRAQASGRGGQAALSAVPRG